MSENEEQVRTGLRGEDGQVGRTRRMVLRGGTSRVDWADMENGFGAEWFWEVVLFSFSPLCVFKCSLKIEEHVGSMGQSAGRQDCFGGLCCSAFPHCEVPNVH